MDVTILQGDSLKTLKSLPASSIQCTVTSPPYFNLRDYGADGQIGLEATPEEYVKALVKVFREVWRVTKDDGVLWLNLADTYASNTGSINTPQHKNKRYKASSGIKAKDLIGIPWMVAFALRADGWYLRQDIIWNKPNPMPESVTDRCTKAHEYIFLLSKSERYYYDQDAIRVPYTEGSLSRALRGASDNAKWTNGAPGSTGQAISQPRKNVRRQHSNDADELRKGFETEDGRQLINPLGRNKWSVWEVPTVSYKGAHFATYPPELVEPCILAGSRPGDTVLDPFNGSGTTGAVAIKYHRNYVGCELNPEYIKLTYKRLEQVQPVLM